MQSFNDEPRKMSPPQIAAVTAVGVCALAFVLKLWMARAIGSVAISAAAWHAVAGLLYALLMLGILHSPTEQAAEEDLSDAEREYLQYQGGLQINVKRHEALLALAGSLGLMAVSYLIFRRVLGAQPSQVGAVTMPLVGLGLIFFGMQFLGRFTERVGLQHETPGLVATSFHARTDAFATILAMLALVGVAMGFNSERYLAALIGLLLVADAAQLFVDATRRIVGLEEDSPTAQVPFWVRLRQALRAYAEQMPPIIRWLLRYEDAMSAAELRQARRVAGLVCLGLYLLTGFNQVQLGQLGGVKVLGRWHHIAQAGLVYALWPFSSVRIVPVDRVQRVTVGFSMARAWSPHQETRDVGMMAWEQADGDNKLFTIRPTESKFMLGDTTQVETHVALTYTVSRNAVKQYLFGFERPENLVQRATQQALQELMLVRRLDAVLVEDRSGLERQVEQQVQRTLDELGSGIVVEKCMIRSVHPPVEVLASFVDVASAIEDKAREVNEAEGYALRTVELAKGEAERSLNSAKADAMRRVTEARGQTEGYRRVFAAALANPAAVRDRLTIESQERLLSGRKKVILPRAAGRGRPTIWFSNSNPAPVAAGDADGPPPPVPSPPPTAPPAGAGAPAEGGPAAGGEAAPAGEGGAAAAAGGAG
ncbi:MAG: protease modulator HflK family protein [Fimbriimonadaceae bacterium]|nr:protease modulator HflK family protein [Fimbriimonadaceae bacterium]